MFRFIVLVVVLAAVANAFVPGRSMVTPRTMSLKAAEGIVFFWILVPFLAYIFII